MSKKSPILLGLSGAALALTGTSFATGGNPSEPATPQTTAVQTPAMQTPATPQASLVFGDVDGDGLADVLAIDAAGRARLLMNFGEGRFEDITLASNLAELGGASCALFTDFDGDGDLDLFAGSSATRVWRNLGNATFEAVSSGIEHDLVDLSAQAVDHDQDGRIDLQIHTEAGDLVYRNMGEGRFERLELSLLPAPTHVGWTAPGSIASPEVAGTRGPATPALRRLRRWSAGRVLGGSPAASSNARIAGPIGPGGLGSQPLLPTCVAAVSDSGAGGCIGASSVPELGKLYPLSQNLYVDPTTGNVGLGTTTPDSRLTVEDGALVVRPGVDASSPLGTYIALSRPGGSSVGLIMRHGDGAGGHDGRWNFSMIASDRSFRIASVDAGDTNPQTRLTIDHSSGLVSVKQSLEIRGGADIVERFESSCGPLEPGTVVAIDPENPGQLACSFEAYDTKVAGVVSGAGGVKPGLCLSQDGVLDGETPVAMTGRVYVRCSNENGAIRPGDRLTTATLAGHAMKVTDEQRSVGAVIGKAMSSLDEDTGLVLVLVNLQ